MMAIIQRKFRTLITLAKKGRGKEILDTTANHLVRTTKYRMDELDVDAYSLGRFKAEIPIDSKMASIRDMQLLFDNWPDSREEYDRHYEVYFHWGFEKCFLSFHRDTGEAVHLSFLLTYEDLPKMQKFHLTKKFKFFVSKSCAGHEWLYTFDKFRKLGVSSQATDFVIGFCRENGISTLYSQRGVSNVPSIRYADKIGYTPIAIIYHIQFLHQQKHSGFYFFKPFRK